MEIFFAYSSWFILLCAALAGTLTYWMYSRQKNADNPLAKPLQALLGIFRFTVLFVLLVLLLEPFLKAYTTKTEPATILIALDESESMVLSADSSFCKNQLLPELNKLASELGDYQVKMIGFGARTFPLEKANYQEKVSDFSNLIEEIGEKYAGANIGAIVVASDGIINRGNNPTYQAEQLKAPIYTIALGDTVLPRDLAIKNVKTNQLAYRDNQFPVLCEISASRMAGKVATLSLLKNGVRLASQQIPITSDNFLQEVQLFAKADQLGMQRYELSLSYFEEEKSKSNNSQNVLIEVIESRQKIALLYAQLHPDIASINQSISTNANYELSVSELNALPSVLGSQDLIILHLSGALDATKRGLISQLLQSNKPIWFCLGANSDYAFLNTLILGLNVKSNGALNSVQASVNKSFQLFNYDGFSNAELLDLPPAQVAFGEYQLTPAWNVLYYQQLDRLSTQLPLMGFSSVIGKHRAVLFGEGIWRWRMANYAKEQNFAKFDSWIAKTVQYLTANANKKNFIVNYKKQVDESESVELGAELYNEAYEFVPSADIDLKLSNEAGTSFMYAFSKGLKSYSLNLKSLAPGKYDFVASTILAGKKLQEKGSFYVSPLQLEAAVTTADTEFLRNLASNTGGQLFTKNQFAELLKTIKANPVVKPVSFTTTTLNEAINLKWIFALLMAFLILEWLLRKRNGLY